MTAARAISIFVQRFKKHRKVISLHCFKDMIVVGWNGRDKVQPPRERIGVRVNYRGCDGRQPPHIGTCGSNHIGKGGYN